MRIPHDAHVLVADGRKLLFFRNEGDADYPTLELVRHAEHPNPPHHDQARDTAGQSSSTREGTMGETDFHQLEEDRFAADAAEMLRKRALAGEFETLVVVAPPKTLGELRKHYHKEVEKRLAGEIAKDLTGHTVPQIEEALLKAE